MFAVRNRPLCLGSVRTSSDVDEVGLALELEVDSAGHRVSALRALSSLGSILLTRFGQMLQNLRTKVKFNWINIYDSLWIFGAIKSKNYARNCPMNIYLKFFDAILSINKGE
jgi:hypothetical protein